MSSPSKDQLEHRDISSDVNVYPPPQYPGSPKQQQPRAHAGMTAGPQAEGGPSRKQMLKGREWSHKLFDCSGDYNTCCLSCWCPCIAYSRLRKRYDYIVRNGVPHPDDGGPKCSVTSHCVLYGLMAMNFGTTCGMTVPLRTGIRHRYDIEGDGSEDCLTSWWCTPCALTQESRELKIEESQHSGELFREA